MRPEIRVDRRGDGAPGLHRGARDRDGRSTSRPRWASRCWSRATPAWARPRSPRSSRACSDRPLIRLQCYEGLDVHTALYEWDYPRQMLRLRMAGEQGLDSRVGGARHLLPQVPARAAAAPGDHAEGRAGRAAHRRDRPRRRRLRGVPARGALGLPGHDPRARARSRRSTVPHVLLTSNRTREIGDALRRRCLYLYHRAPELREGGPHHPGARAGSERALAAEIARFLESLRGRRLLKAPGRRRDDRLGPGARAPPPRRPRRRDGGADAGLPAQGSQRHRRACRPPSSPASWTGRGGAASIG